MSSWDN